MTVGTAVAAQQESKADQALKNRKQQKIGHAVQSTALSGAKLGHEPLLLGADGLQGHIQAANGDHIIFFQCANLHRASVDLHTAFGIRIGNGPAAVIIPGQNRMVPGHCGQIQMHIAGLASSNDIFPMGQGEAGSVLQAQPCPDLRLPFEKHQRFQAPPQ